MNYRLKSSRLPVLPALAMVLCTLLSACGVPAAGSNEPITLTIVIADYVQGKTDRWLADEAIPAFEKSHPSIRVETIYLTWSTLDETVQGFFTAGKGADILNLRSEHLPQYGDRLAPLNPYLGEQVWAGIKHYVPSTLDTVTWKGEMRGLPWLTAPRAYMCRTDLASSTATFADAITEAKKATRIEGNALKRAGLVTTGRLDDWQEWLSLILGLGGKLYKEDGTPAFDSAEARAALKFMYDRRRAVYPNETLDDLPRAKGSRLADGTAACVWGTLWLAPAPSDPLWSKIEISPGPTHPAFTNSRPVVQVFTDWLAVPAYSKHIPEAAELLKFLGSAENQNSYNSHFGSLPPRKDAWTGYVARDGIIQKVGELMDKYGIGFADFREPARLREIVQYELLAYFTDEQDLETTLMNIQTQYTRALEE